MAGRAARAGAVGIHGHLPNVLPEVDVVVEAGVEGFAEFVVGRSAKAAANPALARLRFGLSSSGLTTAEEDGGIVARAAGGKPVFRGPAPRMWDSAGVPVSQGVDFVAGVGGIADGVKEGMSAINPFG